jgi:Second Messenger Oligonucleotide or Dinucleotide Synthetase domain
VKFDDHFQGLLTSTVNLNPDRLRQLDEHVGAIDATLRDDSELSRQIQKLIPQGSLAQRTIIKPVSGVEFDADLLVRLKQQWVSSGGRSM